MTLGYRRFQRDKGCDRLKAVTLISGYRGVSISYGGLQGVTKDYRGLEGLQRVTGGYKGL